MAGKPLSEVCAPVIDRQVALPIESLVQRVIQLVDQHNFAQEQRAVTQQLQEAPRQPFAQQVIVPPRPAVQPSLLISPAVVQQAHVDVVPVQPVVHNAPVVQAAPVQVLPVRVVQAAPAHITVARPVHVSDRFQIAQPIIVKAFSAPQIVQQEEEPPVVQVR